MTTQNPTTDQLIRAMLVRRAEAARPAGLLEEIVRQAAGTPQRRPSAQVIRLRPWSGLQGLASLAALLVVAVVAVFALRPIFVGPGTSPSPAATPTAVPTPTATVVPTPSGGIPVVTANDLDFPTLEGGTWQTEDFEPHLVFTVPDGLWVAGIDVPRQFWLRARLEGAPITQFDVVTLVAIREVFPDGCASGIRERRAWDPAVGLDAFLDHVEAEMAFDFGPRTPVEIFGQPALQVEFTAPDMTHCALGFIPLFETGFDSPFGNPPAGQADRWIVTELNGQTVLIATWTDDPARRDAVWAAADTVLASIEITP